MNITYLPWSQKVLSECLLLHKKGKVPTLDLELTARCTKARCIYCDSRPGVGKKDPKELTNNETEKMIRQAKDLGLRWVYTCGLGEPFEDEKFERLVDLLSELDVRISLFTNGLFINRAKAKWLASHKVCLVLKLDTFDEDKFDEILGVSGAANKIYQALGYLLDAGYEGTKNGNSNLALSIVPTKCSYDGIEKVIKFAKRHRIFPSIGELEQAGWAIRKHSYDLLSLSQAETELLKKKVEELLWKDYKRPICPTIITGLHIDNLGNCVVDRLTGLNCKWFLLKDPDIKILGNVRNKNIGELFMKMRAYRKKSFQINKKIIASYKQIDYVFGGCGGNPSRVVQLANEYL